MNVRTVTDTAMLSLDEEAVPETAVTNGVVDLDLATDLHEKLTKAGVLLAGSQGGRALLMNSQHWKVTSDPTVLAAWKPGCDCDLCRLNRDEGVQYLLDNPGRFIAYCDMEYTQVLR